MKVIKFFGKLFLLMFLALFVAWTLLLAALQTEGGQKQAIQLLMSYVEQYTNSRIQINKFSFSFPLNIKIEGLSIEQNDSLLLSIKNLDIGCSYPRLLQGRLVFSHLQGRDVNLYHLPNREISLNSSDSKPWTSLLPIYVKIENLDLHNVKISPHLLKHPEIPEKAFYYLNDTTFHMKGMITHNPFLSTPTAHLLISAQHPIENLSPLTLGLDTQNQQLSLSIHLNAFALQNFNPSFHENTKANLACFASATLSTWHDLLKNSLNEDNFIEGRFTLSLDGSESHSPLISTLIEKETRVRSRFILKSQQGIELKDIKVENPHIHLVGESISIAGLDIQEGNFKGRVDNLAVIQPFIGKNIQGEVNFDLFVSGSLLTPLLDLKFSSNGLSYDDHTFQNIKGSFQTNLDDFSGKLDLALNYKNIPLKAMSTFLLREKDKMTFDRLQLEAMQTQLSGQVSVSLSDGIWTGSLQGQLENLDPLSYSKESAIQGRGHLKLILSGDSNLKQKKQQQVKAEIYGHNIQWKDWKAEQGNLLFTFNQAQEDSLELALYRVESPSSQFNELSISTKLHESHNERPFTLNLKGQWRANYAFTINGKWTYQHNKLDIVANQLNGYFGPYPLQLMQPFQLRTDPDALALSGIWLRWGEAELQGDFSRDKQNFESRFKTNAVPSELFHFFSPDLPLSGRVTLEGVLEGPLNQPKGQFSMELHHMQIIEDIFAKKPLINGHLFVDFNDNVLQLKSELEGIGRTPLSIVGMVPVRFSLNPLLLDIDRKKPFELSLSAEGELDPYLHLFYNDTVNLSGHTKFAINLNGQIDHPQIQGTVNIINGAFESLNTGTIYHNIQARLEGNGSKIILTQLTAQDKRQGSIEATGEISVDLEKHFPFEFQILPSNVFILDSDYVNISASGNLRLIGNAIASKLQGELTVDQAYVDLEETLPRRIKHLDVKYLNVNNEKNLQLPTKPEVKDDDLELDIKLVAPNNVIIEGKHIKSQWKGSIQVTGTPENFQLDGGLRINHGEYNFNGKKFNLIQGNIHFAGDLEKKSNLYVVASKEIGQINAEIIVKGPIGKPAISFRSTPPLSQREVLSYILFNRGISDITSDQGEQLSQSFISLNSSDQTKSSDDFLSRLRNNIGIDRLDLIANESPENRDFGLQIGKHITENMTLSINQNMTSLSPIISLEANLRKNLKAQAQVGVGEDAPIRMFIKWKRDY